MFIYNNSKLELFKVFLIYILILLMVSKYFYIRIISVIKNKRKDDVNENKNFE